MTLAQMFSCEFCEISKNTFFTEHVWATASVLIRLRQQLLLKIFIKKETLVQVFSCEFYEIFKSNFFHGTPPAAASEIRKINFERNLSVMYTKTNFIMHVLSYREKQGKTNCEIFGFILHQSLFCGEAQNHKIGNSIMQILFRRDSDFFCLF